MKVSFPHHLLPPPKFKIQMLFWLQIEMVRSFGLGIPEDCLALRICGSVLAATSAAALKEFCGFFFFLSIGRILGVLSLKGNQILFSERRLDMP